jgi:hypothetical protein
MRRSWNRTLMYNRGVALGQEFRGKGRLLHYHKLFFELIPVGVNVALGPMM